MPSKNSRSNDVPTMGDKVRDILLTAIIASLISAPAGFFAAILCMPSKEQYDELKRSKLDATSHEFLVQRFDREVEPQLQEIVKLRVEIATIKTHQAHLLVSRSFVPFERLAQVSTGNRETKNPFR